MTNNTINKFVIKPIAQRLSTISVSTQDVKEMEAGWKFFFILASGRSGTNFLSDLLMNETNRVYVYHEPVLEDMAAQVAAYYSDAQGLRYLQNFRKREICSRIKQYPAGIYGEVNPQLRYHVRVIQKAFPGSKVLHIVRDGRKVVRSTLSRKTYTIRRPNSMAIHPLPDDPWRERWDGMDRFQRICWNWMNDNRRLRITIGHPIQFESYLSDFDYFEREIASPLGITIARADWQAHISTPRNTTGQFTFPDWNEWTKEQQKSFEAICGEEMVLNGYKM